MNESSKKVAYKESSDKEIIRSLETKLAVMEERVAQLEMIVKQIESNKEVDIDDVGDIEGSSDSAILTEADKVVADSPAVSVHECEFCDFRSAWEFGLTVHYSMKHKNIPQIDGNLSFLTKEVDLEDNLEDELYKNTEHYWKTGYIGTVYQSYLDVMKIIDNSSLNEKEKIAQKEAILAARKDAFVN